MNKLAQNFGGGTHSASLCAIAYAVNAESNSLLRDSAKMDPQELIKKLIEATGLKDGPLAKAINHPKVTQPQLHKLRNGGIKEPKDDLLRPLADYFGLNSTAPFRDSDLASKAYGILFDTAGNYRKGQFANVVVTEASDDIKRIAHEVGVHPDDLLRGDLAEDTDPDDSMVMSIHNLLTRINPVLQESTKKVLIDLINDIETVENTIHKLDSLKRASLALEDEEMHNHRPRKVNER